MDTKRITMYNNVFSRFRESCNNMSIPQEKMDYLDSQVRLEEILIRLEEEGMDDFDTDEPSE